MARNASYCRYWGKARSQEKGGGFHLLPYHSLDVAAVGDVLLQQQRELTVGLATFLDTEAEPLRCWLRFLLAIHDVGKFSDGFQGLQPDMMQLLQERAGRVGYDERHDTLGFRFAAGTPNRPGVAVRMFVGKDTPDLDPATRWDLLKPWLNATAGHHGCPPILRWSPPPLSDQFPKAVVADATAFLNDVRTLLLPDGPPFSFADPSGLRAFRRVSWLFAGLAVAADWIGSNEAWFDYCSNPMPLAAYWRGHALPQAKKAVTESGLLAATPAAWSGLRGLFPKIESLTSLQQLAEEVDLSDYPQLFVVEEVTGGGKTEAALALAHRLMDKRAADGVYVALPTMATANAMHRRVEKMYRQLFAAGTSPSLILAHSASRMALALEEKNRPDRDSARGEDTSSRQCSEWLSDSRKKALLAHVGVGTIDQALLAVLAARHQSMRLFGLCRKVLIVDEVHACDSYVHLLLCTLLRFHAALGGSAILLSATLPARMRADLVKAFGESISAAVDGAQIDTYPLVTHLTAEGLREYPVTARESACRRVEVCPLQSEDEVNKSLSEILDAGGCACWVRNTVDDALDAYREWVGRLGPQRVTLFHARFALVDRLRIESGVLDRFGPESNSQGRRSQLLIATQVVEQSLDLDFDGMVSDLAPVDLLIQRAGRLKRHTRDCDGNRVEGLDQRPAPELGVFLSKPIPDADAGWFASVFPRAAWVYPHHGQLWLSARWLCERGHFTMPEDARAMIEAVYGEAAQEGIPEGLLRASQRAEGEGSANAAQGRLNSLDLEAGYEATTAHWKDDAYAPTRLGEPTVTVRLAQWDDGRLVPWAGADPRHAWQLSQLTVRRARISGESPGLSATALEAVRGSMPDQGKHCVVLPLESGQEGWIGSVKNGKGEAVRVCYDGRFGLQYLGGDGL